jgi:geranylgeranyl pyrophosphate synthase
MGPVDGEFERWWTALQATLSAQLAAQAPPLLRAAGLDDEQAIDAVFRGGKKLRGCLALAVCDALGAPIEAALPSALTIEYVQAASLVHDDVIDGDTTRRERRAAWVVFGSRRAVLLGDVIFAAALARSAEIGREEVLTLARAIALTAAGACREALEVPSGKATAAQAPRYGEIIHLKTGVLFAAAAELGAVAARAVPAVRQAACEFGRELGAAYQIADDLHDLVQGVDGGARAPRERAALAVLHAGFNTSGDEPNDSAAALERLAGAMQAEIGRRIGLARRALGVFPRGAGRVRLGALPDAIVRAAVAPSRALR